MRGESKEERFERIVQKRVQNVLDGLQRLSQCSNKRIYQWNDQQLKKIWAAVDHDLMNCKESFKNAEKKEFKL